MGGKSWLLDELCNDLPTSTENNYWCYFYFKTMFRTWFLSLETFFLLRGSFSTIFLSTRQGSFHQPIPIPPLRTQLHRGQGVGR